MTPEQRSKIIDELCNRRIELAFNDRATADLLYEAFRHGRIGYEAFSDDELQGEYEDWMGSPS